MQSTLKIVEGQADNLHSQGSGLLTTFTPNTTPSEWIGYQVIFGAGCGVVCSATSSITTLSLSLTHSQGLQIPLIAIQRVLPETQVAEGTSIIIFIQTFGGDSWLQR